jgi:hypothetical protein
MAHSMLGHNLGAIKQDGTIVPVEGELSRTDESGHAAMAIGEYFRATGETSLKTHQGQQFDLVDLAARCVTAQAFMEEEHENGLAYSALGLLSFGPAKDRNQVWERLLDPTREALDRRLLARSDYFDHLQGFNIAKSVARFSLGLSKKDETGRLLDKYIERVAEFSSAGFVDDAPKTGVGGMFDVTGVMALVFIRQSLQLHANMHLRERKLPSIRTVADKYLRLLPDMVRSDGLGWAYGRRIGAYGQMHLISLILQSMRDGWIADDQRDLYNDILRRLFQYFFMTYLDQENGYLVVRDSERETSVSHTSRIADYDGARYLCQWSRLAKSIGGSLGGPPQPPRNGGRYVIFDKGNKKEQGLFLYQDAESGLHVQLPLTGSGGKQTSDYLAFPHCPGVFDWPVNRYMPVMVPELKFGENVVLPCFYGKRCVTGMGLRKSIFFRYEQPELITLDQRILPNFGNCKVTWSFLGRTVSSEFIFTVNAKTQLDSVRMVLPIATPHSRYRLATTFALGQEGHRCSVVKDDFQCTWRAPEVVSEEPLYKTCYGKVHYLQVLERDHPLVMRPGQQYRLVINYEPDIVFAGE